ncbi:MAG: S8 family serine peptidase [Planctomycetes bacterium]|nr:S8 family serine peptidase [Planctomycetota bacterium]
MFLTLLSPILSCAFLAQEPEARFVNQPGHLELSGRMIARPVQDNPEAREAARAEVQDWVFHEYPEVDELILTVPAGMDENSFAAQLMASGEWEYVHPDWICYPINTPNDTYFGNQWHHATMQSEAAWDVSTAGGSYIAAWTDTGVDTDHPDLMNQLLPGYNAVDRLTEAQGGDIEDINGHGTLTGGCIGATGNNGQGVAGCVWDIQLLPVRVSNFSSGGAYYSDLEEGARWAAENGASTISASYSGVNNASIQTTGAYCRSLGALYFYAADNSNQNHSSFDWPDVIVVGATDSNDNKASFSSYGVAVDLTGPGVDVWTTAMGGGYGGASGTSLSTPLANGVASLLWSANPYLDSYEVEARLYASCDDIGAAGEDNIFGHGRLNMENAVNSALQGGMSLSASTLTGGTTASFSVSGAPASTTVYLGYSLSGYGVTDIGPLQTVMGIDNPQQAAATSSDGAGNAGMTKFIPAGGTGITVYMQAVALGDTSNIVVQTIQ